MSYNLVEINPISGEKYLKNVAGGGESLPSPIDENKILLTVESEEGKIEWKQVGVDTITDKNAITYFKTKADWETARDAGLLDPNKYYSYPDMDSPAYETKMRVEYDDGTFKDYIIYCKEV